MDQRITTANPAALLRGIFQRRFRASYFAGIKLLLPLLCLASFAQAHVLENPNKVKAAFLRNFAHYVVWPSRAFVDATSPWYIGILGRDPFGEILETTFQGRTEQGRPFKIYRAESLNELPHCQIIFINYDDPDKVRAALDKLKGKPVLTVGDAPDFLRDGGIIRLRTREYVQMSINLDQARAASLKIETKMLEVSYEVVDNGMVRKVR